MRPDSSQTRRRRASREESLEVRPFARIDDRRAFAALALDYATVAAAAALALRIHHPAVTLLALVVIAGRQSALQGLVHSACHYSLFARRTRNDALEFLYAWPILDSVALYRAQHLEHHRDIRLRTPDRFDYLLDTLQLSRRGRLDRTWLVFLKPLLGHAGLVFLRDQATTFATRRRRALPLAAWWLALLGAAWAGGWLDVLLLYWVVPLLWLYPVLDIWAELSDHLDARHESRNQEGLFYSALLKGHETYHAVHHMYPFVPFYRLPALHDRLKGHGVVMETTRGPLDFLRIVYAPAPARGPARGRGSTRLAMAGTP